MVRKLLIPNCHGALATHKELKVRSRKASASTRLSMLALVRFFDWRAALVIVKPAILICWPAYT